jgi:hypothetical protein
VPLAAPTSLAAQMLVIRPNGTQDHHVANCNVSNPAHPGAMTGDEFQQAAITVFGRSWRGQTSVRFGVDRATVWRWGQHGVSGPADALMALLLKQHLAELDAGIVDSRKARQEKHQRIIAEMRDAVVTTHLLVERAREILCHEPPRLDSSAD